MTNQQAVKADIIPFTVDAISIEKALLDKGITASDNYIVSNKQLIASVSVDVLTSMLALSSESEGGFSQSFNIEGVKAKIKSICVANSISVPDVNKDQVTDKSNIW